MQWISAHHVFTHGCLSSWGSAAGAERFTADWLRCRNRANKNNNNYINSVIFLLSIGSKCQNCINDMKCLNLWFKLNRNQSPLRKSLRWKSFKRHYCGRQNPHLIYYYSIISKYFYYIYVYMNYIYICNYTSLHLSVLQKNKINK